MLPPSRSSSKESVDLDDYLEQKEPQPHIPKSVSTLDDFKEAMSTYETSGQRPPSLQKLYDALLSVPVTSCEAER